MINSMKAFYDQILKRVLQKLPQFGVSESEELGTESAAVQQSGLEIERWAKIIVSFCFASSIEIALVWAQLHSHLPPIFHFLSLFILFGFTSLVLSKFLNSKFPNMARVLEGASVFFVVTSFFVAISIPFPFYLKLTIWVVYAICLLLLVLYNRFYVKLKF